ncbi:hypothetical protein ACWGST_07840 [Agromyces sp. NPDC055520]
MTAPRPIAAASLALFALLLTGCAAAGASNSDTATDTKSEATSETEAVADQSPEAACEIMKGSLDELVALTGGSSDALSGDPAAAVAALKATEVSMSEAATKVTNVDVVEAANGASAAMTEYTVFLDAVIADPANADLTKLTEQATSLQAGIAGLGEVCAG